MRTFTATPIPVDQLTATDLRAEAQGRPDAEAYQITIYDGAGEHPHPETADALFVAGRLGLAWGSDATWADVHDVEAGIDMWLNDPGSWEAAR